MCGACGGGGRAGPSWEDVAGRLDADGQRARARAVRRLLDGTRWKAEPWHGSWVVTGPSGQRHHAADLDALFGLVPAPPLPTAGPVTNAALSPQDGWRLQAGLVWVAAARAAGLVGEVFLPAGSTGELHVRLGRDGRIEVETAGLADRRHRIEVRAPAADTVLACLVRVADG